MNILNHFERICKELQNCNRGCCNKIICVKAKLKDEIHGDRNVYLKLKAECEDGDYDMNYESMISIFNFIFSFITILLTIVLFVAGKLTKELIPFICFIFLICIVMICLLDIAKKFSYIKKWRPYIKIVLEEMDHEIKS